MKEYGERLGPDEDELNEAAGAKKRDIGIKKARKSKESQKTDPIFSAENQSLGDQERPIKVNQDSAKEPVINQPALEETVNKEPLAGELTEVSEPETVTFPVENPPAGTVAENSPRQVEAIKLETHPESVKSDFDLDFDLDDSKKTIAQPEEEIPESLVSKLESYLDRDIQLLNNPEEKKDWLRGFSWLQRNSKARIATGMVVSGIAAFTGTNTAIVATRMGLGFVGGAVGWSGFKAGRRESTALTEYETFNSKIKECYDNGQLDSKKLQEKISQGEISREEALKIYAKLTEVASAKGKEISDKLIEKEEETSSRLNKIFPKLKENKYVKIYSKLDWKLKAAVAAAGSIGIGYAGALAAGSLGGGAETVNITRVLLSGASQLLMSAKQKQPEGSSTIYNHSSEIIELKHLIEENLGGGELTYEELSMLREEREKSSTGRMVDVFTGGVAVASLIGGAYAIFGHNAEPNTAETTGEEHTGIIPEQDYPEEPKPNVPEHDAPKIEHEDIKPVSGIQEQTETAKAALEAKGIHMNESSHDLADEKALAGGSLKGQDGEGMMRHIYDGLKEKGELPPNAEDSSQVIHEMTDEAREMGIIDSQGHLTDKIDADKFDPEKFTNAIVDHDDKYLNSLSHDLSEYDSAHQVSGGAIGPTEAAHYSTEKAIHTDPVSPTAEKASTEPIDPSGFQWKAGRLDLFEDSKSTHLNKDQLNQIFEKDLLKPHAKEYLHNLIDSGRIKPDQVIITPDHKHLMFADPLLSKKLAWDTSFKDTFLGIGSKLKATVDGILSTGTEPNQTIYTAVDQQPKLDGMGDQPSQHLSSGEQVYTAHDAEVQPSDLENQIKPSETPTPIPQNDIPPLAPEIPNSMEVFSEATVRHIENAKNYVVNIQGQEPMYVSGARLSQLIEEAKKYFIDHNATFKNTIEEDNSIELYVKAQLKK